jgi:carbon storage regulator
MLIVTRKVDQSIKVGDDIEVMVCSVDRRGVRIGIKAPDDVRIERQDAKKKSTEADDGED